MIEQQTFVGVGTVYLENLKESKGLLPIGEVSKLELAIETEKLELKSHIQSGGGLADSITRISGVNIAMDIDNFSADNIAMALFGNTTAAVGAAITDEPHKAYPGALVSFVNPPDLESGIEVTSVDGLTTYVLGVDYELSPAGITIIAGGAISAMTEILVDYIGVNHDVIEMLTGAGDSYRLYFEGLNEANSDSPVLVDIFRSKFDPTSSIGFITEGIGNLSMSGTVLKDTTKVGAGISKYVNIKKV
ncbi:MAG: hypothetical protein JKY50_04935 [Oleispira sp.]|nr:hypothetical protein [Oleispira sp.]